MGRGQRRRGNELMRKGYGQKGQMNKRVCVLRKKTNYVLVLRKRRTVRPAVVAGPSMLRHVAAHAVLSTWVDVVEVGGNPF